MDKSIVREFVNTDETLELACVIKTICDEYNISSDDLLAVPSSDHLIKDDQVAFIRRIPYKIPLPAEICPKDQKDPHIRVFKARTICDNSYLDDDDGVMSKLELGLGEFRIKSDNPLRFWSWNGINDYYMVGSRSCYFMHRRDYFRFAKTLKRWQKQDRKTAEQPILPQEMLNEILENSINFLLKGKEKQDEYKKYRIPYKRGILLCGEPGCGKTLTCRWLRELCNQHGLAYRVISMEDYQEAVSRGRVRTLFRLHGENGGIIFFDDMDVMVQNRETSVNAHQLSTFLSEMDGIEPVEGVVFVFTTNYIKELDEAFVRPGRIDLWLRFSSPSEQLRKKFISVKFDKEILDEITVDDLLERTKEYTFAEIEEIRKLFCMDLINELPVNADKIFKTFNKHRKDFKDRAQIQGFSKLEDEEDDYEDDFPVPLPPPLRRR